jgi:membrane protein required for colicin V production
MATIPPYIDIAFAVILLISGLLAMYRGLSREVLSILSWVAAAAAVLYFVVYQKEAMEELTKQFGVPRQVAQVVAGGIIFLVTLIIVHLVTMRISDAILDSRIGLIDRILGFGFGLVRGFVIALIPYMFYVFFVPKDSDHLPMVQQSFAVNQLLKPAAGTVHGLYLRHMPPSLLTPGGETAN